MRRFLEWVVDHPLVTILLLAVLTAFFWTQLKGLRFETDAESMIPPNDPAFVYNELVEDVFGVRDPIIVGIINDNPKEEGIFNPRTLALIKRLSEKVADIEGVVSIRKEDVASIATADNIVGTEEGIEVTPFMEEVPEAAEGIARLRAAIYGNDTYLGWLVSRDGRAAIIMAKMEESGGTREGVMKRANVYFSIKRMIEEERARGAPERMYTAGRGAVEVTYGILSSRDLQRFMPLVVIVVIAVLFLTYRSLRGVILPFIVVVASVIWALGIMAMTGIPLYFISTMMPVILMAIGVAYGIHILGRYYEEVLERPGAHRRDMVMAAMSEMWAPVVMTSLTTAAGFLSLMTAYMLPIRYFGIFTAVGIIAAMLFSLTFIPACLALMKPRVSPALRRRMDQTGELRRTGITASILGRAGESINRRRRSIAYITLAVIAVSAVGLIMVRADSTWIGSFSPHSEVRIATTLLNERFQGTLPLNVVFEGQEEKAIQNPDLLKKMDALQQHVEQDPEVGGSLSIAEFIKRMNRVMNEDRPEMELVPDSENLIAQYLLLYSFSGDPDDFDEVVDYEYRKANVWFYLKSDHTTVIDRVVRRIEDFVRRNFSSDDGVVVNLSGLGYLSHVWVRLLLTGQITSLFTSILAVFLITAVMFRSLSAGFYNIVPISLATLFNFGIIGTFSIPVDVSIALTSSIVIGIGIDYTIHFLSKYRLKVRQGSDAGEATVITMVTAGKAIFFNAVVVTAGFLVLLASSFPPNAKLGELVALNMGTSFLGAMTVLPALLGYRRPKFIFSQRSG